jgi:putative endonuclease
MPFWTYIIQSASSGRYYCGSTNDLDRRISQHNNPNYTATKTTKRFKGAWKLILAIPCADRAEAMSKERQIKKRGIGRFLKNSIRS